MEEIEALLKHLGLTEYEAKAYVTLIKNGTLTADKISVLGRIPLPRVYDTMTSLASKGLIFVSKTRPQTFRVVDPKKILDVLKEDEKKKLESKLKSMEEIVPQFIKMIEGMPKELMNEEEEILAQVKQKVNIDVIWKEFEEDTKEEFLSFAGDLSWVDKKLPEIRRMIKRGIKYKIIFGRDYPEVIERAKKVIRLGAEARHSPGMMFRAIITDGKKVYIVQKYGKSGEKEYEFSSMLISNRVIADVFRKYFYALWEHSMPVEKMPQKHSKKRGR
ncbi:MAG: helix-turn-helix domain-containing protein [Candidatus Aenigmatarchaeota archaeon]